jgi:hypothetical protein
MLVRKREEVGEGLVRVVALNLHKCESRSGNLLRNSFIMLSSCLECICNYHDLPSRLRKKQAIPERSGMK